MECDQCCSGSVWFFFKQSTILNMVCCSFSVSSVISTTTCLEGLIKLSTVVLKIRAISMTCLSWGIDKPISQEFTALRVTPSLFPSSDWVIPKLFLSLAICSQSSYSILIADIPPMIIIISLVINVFASPEMLLLYLQILI